MADTAPTLRDAAQQALEALVHMTGVLNAAGWATGHADAAVKALRAALAEQAEPQWQLERMRHIANEWADMATNGLQWLRNIKEGISNVDDALANMAGCYEHCRRVNDAQGLYGEAAPPAPAAAEQAEPVEVTPEMLKAGAAEWLKYGEYEAQFPLAQGFDKLPRHLQVGLSRATHVYRAMRAAAPPAPARQEPLTSEQVKSIVRDAGYDHAPAQHRADFINGMRHAERAHGITAAPAEGGAA